jgi:hypothetical protein
MKIDTNLFSMQISVPHSEYGPHEYFMPVILQAWVAKYKLNYEYTGGDSWGNGLTNGITNKESTYMIRNIQETDATAFRLRFPQCKVHLSKQYEYT